MGKRKRNKKSTTLSQEEIWDDSALIQSWEDAVEEYKLYHSIQARGENVEEVLREAEASDASAALAAEDDEEPETAQHDYVEPLHAKGDAKPPGEHGRSQEFQDGAANVERGSDAPERTFVSNASKNAESSSVPQMLLGGGNAPGQDDGLKNLMMSWYFAGYYTGLYEGQQRASQQS